MDRKYIIVGSAAVCVLLYIIEQVAGVNYIVKTIAKVLMFTSVPYLFGLINKISIKQVLNFKDMNRRNLRVGIFFGVVSFFIVLGAYYVLQEFIDLPGIAAELRDRSGITPANFILTGLYITMGNSFLEEFFFRGFIFLNLYKLENKRLAYIYSALAFGLYHIAIFRTWFSLWVMGLALTGLVAVGFVFNWLDAGTGSIMNSWLVHIFADSAIVLIGLSMFGII